MFIILRTLRIESIHQRIQNQKNKRLLDLSYPPDQFDFSTSQLSAKFAFIARYNPIKPLTQLLDLVLNYYITFLSSSRDVRRPSSVFLKPQNKKIWSQKCFQIHNLRINPTRSPFRLELDISFDQFLPMAWLMHWSCKSFLLIEVNASKPGELQFNGHPRVHRIWPNQLK